MRPWREFTAFLVHLRLHYQFFILSGAFLCGAVFAGFGPPVRGVGGGNFLMQLLNVHILLFGGVTVYNSYWDKDTGPIGGLRTPPPLAPWTLPASWALQVAGLALCLRISLIATTIYAAAMLFFWLYSRPGLRWKGRPWLSLVAIGVSTGVCGFLLGYFHAGRGDVSTAGLGAACGGALGTALIIVSLFPMSQVYQVEEDLGRRDLTFTARYGLAGMRRLYLGLFFPGVALLSLALASLQARLGGLFLAVGIVSGLIVWTQVRNLRMSPEEYARVMRTKYLASALFSVFLAALLGLQAAGYFSAPSTATLGSLP